MRERSLGGEDERSEGERQMREKSLGAHGLEIEA